MGHSDISVSLNVYTHTGCYNAKAELAKLRKKGDIRTYMQIQGFERI